MKFKVNLKVGSGLAYPVDLARILADLGVPLSEALETLDSLSSKGSASVFIEPFGADLTDLTDLGVEAEFEELKMWLAVRTDLDLSRGKLATQAGHAFQMLTIAAQQWCPRRLEHYMTNASPKITVRADNEAMLFRVYEEAAHTRYPLDGSPEATLPIPACIVRDAGRSEVAASTPTVVAFGPCYRSDLPPFLKRLRIL